MSTQTSPQFPYVRSLRTELVSAVAAQRDRRGTRQRRLTAVAAVATAFVLLVGAINVLDATSRPALAIEGEGGTVSVAIADASADPQRMTRELAEAGLDVVVVGQPVPATLVGRWVGGYSLTERSRLIDWTGDAVAFPRDVTGLVLQVGVAGGAGGSLSGSAFARGGLLACSGLQGADSTQAAAEMSRRGLSSAFLTDEGLRTQTPSAGTIVTDATLDSRGTVVFSTALAGTVASDDLEQHCG